MDIATIGGLILGIGAVAVSFIMEGGHVKSILQAPAMIIVIVGTFGAATATSSVSQILAVPKLLKIAFFGNFLDPANLIEKLCDMAKRSRKDGLLSLENELHETNEPFLKKAIELVVDGMEGQKIREILEIEMVYISERHKAGATFFQKLGGFSPTLGIIGTVLGLIHALSNISNSSDMASSIAGAFIATLWGVALANLVYLPIGDKLKHRHQEEILYLELVIEGIISLSMGDNPRLIRTKLLSFLMPGMRSEG
ncbi:MAG: flagellar motor protein [Thermodesulfobacteriota bacterium]|nr:flagellar motor protein [Thermodesulfobacteriota bacterium]